MRILRMRKPKANENRTGRSGCYGPVVCHSERTKTSVSGVKNTTCASGYCYDTASSRQIMSVSASSWLLSSRCRCDLRLMWLMTELIFCNWGLLWQGSHSNLLLFFQVIETVWAGCVWCLYISSAILYCIGAFPCHASSLSSSVFQWVRFVHVCIKNQDNLTEFCC